MIKRLLFLTVFFSLFIFGSKSIFAQYCASSSWCEEQGSELVCSGSGGRCNGSTDCPFGESCVEKPIIVYSEPGFCDYSGGSCLASCPRAGFVVSGCGVPYYPPSPPPIATPPPSGTPQPTPTTEPQPGYICVPGNCCQPSYTVTTSYAACAASCACDVTDQNAGASSCEDLADTAADAVIFPGQTQSWITWAPPTNATADQRLNGTSPGLITKNYTSPGNKLTMSYIFQEPETRACAFYVFDDDNKTWYFYQGPDKPAVIMTTDDNVLTDAKKIGYTQITDFSTSNAANAATVEKRVYRLDPDGNGEAWIVNGAEDSVRYHIPRGWDLIPYVNCASTLMADDHKYFGTNVNKDIQWLCSQRTMYSNFRDDDELVPPTSTGNYFGLEKDSEAVFNIVNPFGNWPRTNTVSTYSDYSKFAFAFLMQKGIYDYRQGSLRPGFLRMPVLQIPIATLHYDKGHELYAYVSMSVNSDCVFRPVEDEQDDNACLINKNQKAKVIQPVLDETPPHCENFIIKDSNGSILTAETPELKIGQTYTISTKALLGSKIYSFDNSNFDSATPSENSAITNWDNNSLSTFSYATCGSGGLSCADPVSGKVLKIAGSGSAITREIESNEDLSNNIVWVEFDAKANSAGTLNDFEIIRTPYISIDNNLLPQPEGDETKKVQFVTPNYGTNPPVTTSWQHFSGFVNFSQAAQNDETRFQLKIRPINGGTDTYFDNISVRGWEDPANVHFGMASATAFDGITNNDPMDKCDTSVHAINFNNNTFNASTGLYADAITIPEYRPGTNNTKPLLPGTYNVLATFEYGSGLNLSGNPGTVGVCPGVNTPDWDNSIASDSLAPSERCYKPVTISTCSDAIPAVPEFTEAPPDANDNPYNYFKDGSEAPYYIPQVYTGANNTITFASIESNHGDKVKISVKSAALVGNDPTTEMRLTITKRDTATPTTQLIDSTPVVEGGKNVYDFEFTPTADFSNDINVVAQAVNTESCTSPIGKFSPTLTARIVMIDIPSGNIFEVDRTKVTDLSTINCYETYNSDGPGSVSKNLKSLDVSQLTNASIQANMTVGSTFNKNPLTGVPYDYTNTSRTTFRLPYFPGPVADVIKWGNQIQSLQLDFTSTGENGYHCVSCNAASDTSCRYPAADRAGVVDEDSRFFTATDTFQNMNFYLVKASTYDSWWQTRGGLVFAEASGTAIKSVLPLYQSGSNWLKSALCLPDTCQPFIAAKKTNITPASTAVDSSAGLPITNGTISDTNGSLGYLSQNNANNIKVTGANTTYALPTYTDFRDLIDFGSSKIMDLNPSTAYQQFSNPDPAKIYDTEADGSNVYVYKYDSGATIDVATNKIDVKQNSKIIVFINGNLTIQGDSDVRQIKVDASDREYLIFIVNGDITFDPSIGYDPASQLTLTDPLVEGVYFANSRLIIKSKVEGSDWPQDLKFVGAGSFIGRVGVQLNRKFAAFNDILSLENNAKSPVEQFNFRPDFVVNAPDVLRQPDLTWAEIN